MSALQQLAGERPEHAPGSSLASRVDNHSDLVALVLVGLGFVLRVKAASGTFLDPDEALHFFIANRASWAQAYQASLTMAHPPLLIFALYWLRFLGTSEFVLRLPPVLAGTAFCWIFFKWLAGILGRPVGLIGLVFVTLLWPSVLLSAEVRQYEFLLLFLISSAYFLERALVKNSTICMVLSAACLYLGMLSHYSAFLFVAAIGVYAALRLAGGKTSARVIAAWALGQAGALGLAIFLYRTHLSKIKGTTMAAQAFESWLYKSYFHRGSGSLFVFVVARTFSVFQYVLGQFVVGDLACLVFVAGVVLLWKGKVRSVQPGPDNRQLAVFLSLPFVLNCGAAVLDAYPYGGTRHCVFLTIFAVAGIAVAVARIAAYRVVRGLAISVFIVALCLAFRSVRHPYIARADQSRAQIERAVAFVHQQIPEADPIFVDYESGLMLGHYLCDQQTISYDGSVPGFLVFHCGSHRVISTVNDLWAFSPQSFLSGWNDLARNGEFNPGETIWIAQVGWIVTLDDGLRKNFPEFHDLPAQSFGNNIKFFKLTVGQPMPGAWSPPVAGSGRPE